MKGIRVRNVSRDQVLAERARHATRMWERLVGLLGTPVLHTGEGLVLEPCNSVHMWGMRYPLDVIFADVEGCVLGVVQDLRPWRVTRIYRGARMAVELPVGVVERTGTCLGDKLALEALEAE